jgi:hypothetical protein
MVDFAPRRFQHMLLRPASGTARSKPAINHYSENARHSVPFTLLMVSLQTEHPALFAAAGALLGSLQK